MLVLDKSNSLSVSPQGPAKHCQVRQCLAGPCVSCVTCQVSQVMCHVSWVTCQVSQVMCHVSGVTCQVSQVMCHVSGVTCQVSQVMCHVSRVTCLPPGPSQTLPGQAVQAHSCGRPSILQVDICHVSCVNCTGTYVSYYDYILDY